MRTRTLVVAVTVALGVGLIAAAPALADKTPSRIDVTHASDPNSQGKVTYKGKVRSPKNKCIKGRKVKLVHKTKDGPDFIIGETETDDDGNWKIKGPYPPNRDDDKIVAKLKENEDCEGDADSFHYYD